MNAPAPLEQPNVPTGTFMPVASIRRHWRVGLMVMLVTAVLGLGLVWLKGNQYVYSVTATLYVAPRFVNILQESKEVEIASYQQFRQFIEHQALTVNRYDIVLEALQSIGDKRKSWQLPVETEREAAERLQAALKVVAVKDSYLITINLESDTAENLDVLVNAVADSFITNVQKDEFFYASDLRLQSLRDRRKQIEATIKEKSELRTKIAQELGITFFSDTSTNPYDQLLLDTQTALAEAQRERMAAESNLAVFEDNRGHINKDALDAAVFDTLSKDSGLNSLKADFHLRRSKMLEQISGLDNQHPLKIKVQHELRELDDELNRLLKQESERLIKAYLDQRRAEVVKTKQLEQSIQQQLNNHLQKASWFATEYGQALALNNEIERGRKQLEAIDNRIEFFELESQAPGFIRVENYARPPTKPIKGGRKKKLMLAAVGSMVLGLLVPILIDLSDRCIKTTNQVQKILGFAPLAGILETSDDIEIRRMLADQKRRLALALEREFQLRGTRLILLTSVKPDAGVTGLAMDLALEFADLGSKALVVETNAITPDSRYQADMLHPGLVDILSGMETVDDAIIKADGNLPDRIGVGLPGARHLFAYNKLREFLDGLKSRYDIILLDAPPITLSADSEFLASFADLSLLLVGAGQVQPGELKRAAGLLQKSEPAAVSFIVTHLKIYQGGGYFSQLVQAHKAADQEGSEIIRTHLMKDKV